MGGRDGKRNRPCLAGRYHRNVLRGNNASRAVDDRQYHIRIGQANQNSVAIREGTDRQPLLRRYTGRWIGTAVLELIGCSGETRKLVQVVLVIGNRKGRLNDEGRIKNESRQRAIVLANRRGFVGRVRSCGSRIRIRHFFPFCAFVSRKGVAKARGLPTVFISGHLLAGRHRQKTQYCQYRTYPAKQRSPPPPDRTSPAIRPTRVGWQIISECQLASALTQECSPRVQ